VTTFTTIDLNWTGRPRSIAAMLIESAGAVAVIDPGPGSTLETLRAGLRARGGFQVDETWQNGKLISAILHSDSGEPCAVTYGGKTVDVKIKKGKSIILNESLGLN